MYSYVGPTSRATLVRAIISGVISTFAASAHNSPHHPQRVARGVSIVLCLLPAASPAIIPAALDSIMHTEHD